jgi:hypothetical protein
VRVGCRDCDCRSKTHTKGHFSAVFGDRSTVDEAAVKAVDQGEDRFVDWEGNGHWSLGFPGNHPYSLLGEGRKDNRGLLHNTIRPIQRRTQAKAAKIGAQKSAVSSGQRHISQIDIRFELIQHPLYCPDLAPRATYFFLR